MWCDFHVNIFIATCHFYYYYYNNGDKYAYEVRCLAVDVGNWTIERKWLSACLQSVLLIYDVVQLISFYDAFFVYSDTIFAIVVAVLAAFAGLCCRGEWYQFIIIIMHRSSLWITDIVTHNNKIWIFSYRIWLLCQCSAFGGASNTARFTTSICNHDHLLNVSWNMCNKIGRNWFDDGNLTYCLLCVAMPQTTEKFL